MLKKLNNLLALPIKVEKHEESIKSIIKQLQELKLSKTQTTVIQSQTHNVQSYTEEYKILEIKINQLVGDTSNLRSEFAKWMKDFQDSLNRKVDNDALLALEKQLIDKLTEVVKALTKQLADKNDTKKALKLLEKQLKNLYDLFIQRSQQDGATNLNEDDAMFTKKPLGGMSCASCEKDIINLQGKKVDFLPWNKLPFRDPSERIARVSHSRFYSHIQVG